MAHVKGGYIITTSTQNKEGALEITQDTLKQIAHLLGVDDATGIRAIVVYGSADNKG